MVYSDQKSLKHLSQQPLVSINQQNKLSKLLGFNFEVIYKLSLENKVVDSLSHFMKMLGNVQL